MAHDLYGHIDPGAHGGIAIVEEDDVRVMPFSKEALLDLKEYRNLAYTVMCCLEKVGPMPKQGVVSMFNFGMNYGYIKGVLEAYNIPYQEIPPKRWKKEFGLDGTKAKSIEVCQNLCPEVNLLATERSRVPHDGMAEALLMAIYARRKL